MTVHRFIVEVTEGKGELSDEQVLRIVEKAIDYGIYHLDQTYFIDGVKVTRKETRR